MLRRAAWGAAGRVAGRQRFQRFFADLYDMSLFGLNFGEGDCHNSGESVVLQLVRSALGQRPYVVFDVGANVGAYTSDVVRHLGPNGIVWAFEPAEDIFPVLERNTRHLPNVQRVQSALGDEPGESPLFRVPGFPGLSSLHARDLRAHHLSMSTNELVKVARLDDFCDEHNVQKIDLLKLDVEGHELSVLVGAENLISAGRVANIQFEFGGTSLDARVLLRDFFNLLGSRYTIFRVVRDGLVPIQYSERHEIFVTINYLARLQGGN